MIGAGQAATDLWACTTNAGCNTTDTNSINGRTNLYTGFSEPGVD